MAVVAKKLRHGDHIAVIAPSRSMSIIRADSEKIAISALKRLGLEVEYGNVFFSYFFVYLNYVFFG